MGLLERVDVLSTISGGSVIGAYYAFTKLPGMMLQRKLDARLDEVVRPADDPQKEATGLVKSRHEGPLPAFEKLVAASARGSALTMWVEQSGVKISISGLLLVALVCALIFGFIVAAALRMSVGWLGGMVVGAALPFMFLRVKRTRRLRAFEEAFPEALDLMARALKAGHAFATGLKMVADEMPEPIGPEFRKTFDEQNFGLPMKDSLNNLGERTPPVDVMDRPNVKVAVIRVKSRPSDRFGSWL